MRIIIQYYYDFLRKKTAAVDIEDEESDCSILLKAISVKIDRPIHEFVASIKRDNVSVRIIQGWPLSFYEIKDKSCLNVEFKDIESEESKKQGQALNNRYLMKLGINKMQDRNLSVIKDFEEGENEDDNEGGENSFGRKKSVYNKNERTSLKKIGSQNSNSSSSDEEGSRNKNIDIKKMLDNFLEQLISETKNNRLEEVKKLFNEVSDRLNQEQKEELQKKKLIIINELGKDGFNPLHIAVYNQFLEISKELVEKGANVNVPNNQGWTSIQYAVYRNNLKILKLLLDSPSLDLNYVSKVGTSLTVACQFSKPQALDLILKKNPNIHLQDQSGRSCFDHCQNEECKNLLKTYQKQREEEEQKQNELKSEIKVNQDIQQEPGVFLPPKPPIVTGTLFKIGAFLFNMRERFFVINPDEGTLIRYKSKQHYPLKPLEVIPLKDITHIQMITKSWFMSSDYTYFEINYPNRQVLACRHEQAAKKWVEYLFQACVYSYYTETRNSFNQIHIQDNTVVDLIDNPQQQPIFGALGGCIKDAVKKFENQNKKDDKKKSNESTANKNAGQNGMNNSKLTTKNNTNAKPDSSSNLDNLSPVAPKSSSNAGSRNKLDGPSDSRKNTRSPSPPSQENSTRAQSPTAPEDPNVDLGHLEDDKVTFDSFQILKVLGAGSFGKVFLAKKKDSGNIYAIKALKKRPLIMKRQLRYAVTEANVLKMCNHPFILGLHYALQTPNYLYLVLDFCSGGDISSHLAYKRRFTEEEAIFYIAELVLAIQHIHEKDVVYRDLKPENILIAADGHIKLADFGLSKDNVTDQSKTKSFCGTPAYLSPEMLNNKGATKASDLYGIGAVLYEMLTGDPPYYNDDIPTMYKKIKEGNLTYPSYVSQKAKNIINGLLDRNPKTRLGAQDREQLKRDPFFEGIDWEKLYNKEYKPPITEFENSDIEDDFEDISDKKIFHDFDYEQHNHNINRVKQFSFVRNQNVSQN